ncbi:MaoC family dehydratase [Kiloniella laminariae]|uniref:MaoC family dehydratase n=1 Tax=Kiloniella laminariae TaxID=454162 RepID=UPI00036823B4|nr:MaoC family dehydratase [Kiloniella laminariae]
MKFVTGMEIRHRFTKTVNEGDHSLFCSLTWNPQPLHINVEKARESGFSGVLVNGMYTLSLTLGVSVYDLTMEGLIGNLSIDDVHYHAPVEIGDTLSFMTRILHVRSSRSRPDREIVTFQHFCFRKRDELVLDCHRTTLMQSESGQLEEEAGSKPEAVTLPVL